MTKRSWGAILCLVGLCCIMPMRAQAPRAGPSGDIWLDQRLNEQVPLDAAFRDESGRSVKLAEFLGKRPVILALVYYRCPKLCNQVLGGLLASLRMLKFDAGAEFDVVLVSIDPRETPEVAARKKASYVMSYDRPGAAEGWHFLTGDEKEIRRLAKSVGFRYTYDPKTDLYAHAAGIMVVTPEGKLAQYYYGIKYYPRDLRLALVEASQNRIGNIIDQALLFCLVYDPTMGKYGLAIMSVLRLLGLSTVIILATYIIMMIRREQRKTGLENK